MFSSFSWLPQWLPPIHLSLFSESSPSGDHNCFHRHSSSSPGNFEVQPDVIIVALHSTTGIDKSAAEVQLYLAWRENVERVPRVVAKIITRNVARSIASLVDLVNDDE